MNRRRGPALGRGLESLIPIAAGNDGKGTGLPQLIDIDQVRPSPEQMRKHFPAESLRELADSIRQHGVLQPILVRRLPDGYELIAGERRWRAARLAGVDRIPAIVRGETQAEDSLLLGLIENLQREDLDPIEEARGIKRLIDQFGLTHEEAAARLGKNRVAITQALRLLNACPAVLSATAAGAISAGHARALVGLPTPEAQEQGLKVTLARNLSVRETERWVREYQPPEPRARARRRRRSEEPLDPEMADLAERLQQRFGASVSVTGGRSRGQISFHYASVEELQGLVELLLG
ncbi:MAG TPA: ParB/RepB/Spo0J family partition protein [Candidatus Dormibacteraeota bacterium]|jgi:ParB family chromosome partitioning protein|nr:ParB/RepB/Spo0J family partition protein [Candidatus Dormibacteraeota bacterium]